MTLAELFSQIPSEKTVAIQVMENRNEYTKRKRPLGENEIFKDTPLEKLMDLKVDFAFKQLFGNEKNKHITIAFLNAILQKTGKSRIKDIVFANTEIGREYKDDKQSRLDLLILTDADEKINLEIQFTDKYDMVKRSLYYWSRAYTNPLGKGMDYKKLRPVIAINIVNFDLFLQTDWFNTSYHLYEDEEKFKLTNDMEFHFFEMGKLIKQWKKGNLNPWNSALAKWLLMLGVVDQRTGKVHKDIYWELEEISVYDEALRETLQNWKELSQEQEQRLAYEARLKKIMDEESFKRRIEEGERKSEQADKKSEQADEKSEQADKKSEQADKKSEQAEQKFEQAEQKFKEAEQIRRENEQRMIITARRLLEKGMEIDFVADSTGLTRNEVTGILRDLQN